MINYIKNPKFKNDNLSNEKLTIKNSCNDEITIKITLNKNNLIELIEWNGKGCFVALSVPEFLSENLINKDLIFAKKFINDFENYLNGSIDNEDLFSIFNIVKIQKQKHKCAKISIDLIKRNLEENND